jgi:hypothetical protein
MAANERPLLRGRIEREEFFRDPRGGGGGDIVLPRRDPALHRSRLLSEIDRIGEIVSGRDRDPEATRVVIAAIPALGHTLEPGGLGDKRHDVRVVGEDPETRVVVIDAADPKLVHLRRKLDEFIDDEKVGKHGRKHEELFAVLEHLRVAEAELAAGPEVRRLAEDDGTSYWFEIGCRGGVRGRTGETARSRLQMVRQFKSQDVGIEAFTEYEATEELVYFVRASIQQIRSLTNRVDCVYEYDIAPPDVRDWLLGEHTSAREIGKFRLRSPPIDAPAVALLDTGIANEHPLLREAIRYACSVVPTDSSGVDTHGHGTKTAGVALYPDLGAALVAGEYVATHWIESARLLTAPESESATSEQRQYWPTLTEKAIEQVEASGEPRLRTFCMTVTAKLPEPRATFWSHALDRLAFNEGKGRLICVSAGNADIDDLRLLDGYPVLHLHQSTHDPAQAANVLTVGAYTHKTKLPPEQIYAFLSALAPSDGASPYTSAGTYGGVGWPDIVAEGGNLAFDGRLPGAGVETLSALTTGHLHVRQPLSLIWGTSEAAAHAARMATSIWRDNSDLRPETIRGLLVHSASWTTAMLKQFPNIDERMRICGHGVPDEAFARACIAERATIVVEDRMPNSVLEAVPRKTPPKRAKTSPTEDKTRRVAKFFVLPVPEAELLADPDRSVELRVTLSYLAEPNTFRRRVSYGLDLRWDMQGPMETERAFRERINKLARGDTAPTRKTKSFPWELGVTRRSKGTVQSDRWMGEASMLAGSKLLAVVPVLGWWNRRAECQTLAQPFSLIISVVAEGMDIYTPIQAAISVPVEVEI